MTSINSINLYQGNFNPQGNWNFGGTVTFSGSVNFPGWSLSGNSGTGGTGVIGTTDVQGFSLVVNSSDRLIFSSSGDITASTPSFTVNATSGAVAITAGVGSTYGVTTGDLQFTISAGSVIFTASANADITAAGLSYNIGINGAQCTGSANWYIDAPDIRIGLMGTSTIQIGLATGSYELFLRGAYLEIDVGASGLVINGVPVVTGSVSAPTHVPPAGYNYLIVNSSTGVIEQFSA